MAYTFETVNAAVEHDERLMGGVVVYGAGKPWKEARRKLGRNRCVSRESSETRHVRAAANKVTTTRHKYICAYNHATVISLHPRGSIVVLNHGFDQRKEAIRNRIWFTSRARNTINGLATGV